MPKIRPQNTVAAKAIATAPMLLPRSRQPMGNSLQILHNIETQQRDKIPAIIEHQISSNPASSLEKHRSIHSIIQNAATNKLSMKPRSCIDFYLNSIADLQKPSTCISVFTLNHNILAPKPAPLALEIIRNKKRVTSIHAISTSLNTFHQIRSSTTFIPPIKKWSIAEMVNPTSVIIKSEQKNNSLTNTPSSCSSTNQNTFFAVTPTPSISATPTPPFNKWSIADLINPPVIYVPLRG